MCCRITQRCACGAVTYGPALATTADGGYAEVAYARATGLVRIPEPLSSIEASPLLCGYHDSHALLNLDIEPGALVGIQGIGGLRLTSPPCDVTTTRPLPSALPAPKYHRHDPPDQGDIHDAEVHS